MKRRVQVLLSLVVGYLSGQLAYAETVTLPIPTRTILPGQMINEGDFAHKSYEVSPVAKLNFLVSLDQAQHKEAAKIILVGRPVPLASLTKANDVRKGQETTARFSEDGIEIQGVLLPLRDGVAGQIVPCRNLSSGITVDALVLENGSLSVSAK